MIKYCSFYNVAEKPSFVAESLSSERMRVYVDPYNGKVIAHQISKVNRRSSDVSEVLLKLKEIKKEYDNNNGGRPLSYSELRSEKNIKRIEDIRSILKDSYAKRSDEQKIAEADLDKFIDEHFKNETYSWRARIKRFLRKCFLNRDKLTYWFTVTCNDGLFDSFSQWQKTWETWIANNACRYGIKVMGAYEKGDENGRLHFHGFICADPSFFDETKDFHRVNRYSRKNHKWENNILENLEFLNKFGINEFEPLKGMSDEDFKRTINYTCAYTCKEGGKLYYSRGLPDNYVQFVDPASLYFEMYDGCMKYYVDDYVIVGQDDKKLLAEEKKRLQAELRRLFTPIPKAV